MTDNILAAVTVCSAALYLLCAVLAPVQKRQKLMNACYAAAACINLFLIIRNAVINGYVPFVSMYQVLTFLAAAMTLCALYICMIKKQRTVLMFFPALSGIILIGTVFMSGTGAWHFPPALNSPFFVPHVLLYMISYSLCSVSFVCCLWGLLFKKRTAECDRACVLIVRTALPFMLTGMLCGAAWANEVWGEFWTWDVKECFSLLTMLCYSGYLHMRRSEKLKNASKLLLAAGFFALIFTLLFVNVIPSNSLHTYS